MTQCETLDECHKEIATLTERLSTMADIHAVIALIGAASMGFVIGWTLYFANRGKSGSLSAAELGAMAAVVGGGAVLTWVDKTGALGASLFGTYGIGLLIGFLSYRSALDRRRASGRSTFSLEAAPSVSGRRGFRNFSGFGSNYDESAAEDDTVDALKLARDEVEDLLREVGIALDIGQLSDPDKKALEDSEARLRKVLKQLNDAIIVKSFSSPDVTSLLGVLTTETQGLRDEAALMKQATGQIKTVNRTLAAISGVIDKLKSLA